MENEPKRSEEETSCLWNKPSDIMRKLKMRRKRVVSNRSMSTSVSLDINKDVGGNKKRLANPFAKKRSSSEESFGGKKRILSVTEVETTPEVPLWEKEVRSPIEQEDKHGGTEVLDNNDLGFVFLNEDSIQAMFTPDCFPKLAPVEEKTKHDVLPADWSIKTKARFLSPSSFAWCARVRGNEEAKSITRSVRCQKLETTTQSDLRIELCKCLVYHQHPSVPWFKLFPRFGSDCRLVPGITTEPLPTEHAKTCMYDSWAAAFRSSYQLLRENLCPYFYICAQQYTALFRSAVVSPCCEVNCLITPTSMGFRKSLKSEGIEFTMPLQQLNTQQSDSVNSDVKDLNEESKENKPVTEKDKSHCCVDVEADEQEEQQWKDISNGLQFRKNKEINLAVRSDGQPRTAVLVKGMTQTQILFNYLLNCKSSTANSGPQAGVPPTILSPVPFIGSSLKKLDMRAGIAKMCENDGSDFDTQSEKTSGVPKERFSLDISGPLMPHQLSGIITLLNKTQDAGNFTCAFGTHMYTAPFNAPSETAMGNKKETPSSDMQKCGLAENFVTRLTSTTPVTIRQIKVENEKYNWQS
ncbi:protein downstream neighbor of son homolog [Ciona intestinalis]